MTFGFPPIAQIIHFWGQQTSAFWEHLCHVLMAGALRELRWASGNGSTSPLPYLWFQIQFPMLCSRKGNQEPDGSSCPWGEQACGASPPEREKNCQVLSILGLWSFFLSTKGCCVHWMIDLSLGCLSIAVIQGDEGGLVHMWPLAQGMHSVFAGLSAHPTHSSQELSSEVRSGFKAPSTDSSTSLTNSLAHLRHV